MIAKKLLTTIAFALVLLFSGCAKDDFNEIDGLCPVVTTTNPDDLATDVPLNQIISAKFNEKINPTTISGASFTVAVDGTLIDGTVSQTDSTAIFTPSSLLDGDTEYTATIKTLVKDERGNALQEDYVWTFTTLTLPEYTVDVSSSPAIGGVTAGGGLFNEGTAVTVTAVPNAGYNFINWTDNGTEVSTNTDYTFDVIADITLVANYSLIPPTQFDIILSSSPVDGGLTSGAGLFDQGATVTVTATANAGFTFVNWTDNGNEVSTNADYTFDLIANTTLVANFVLNAYTLNVTAVNGTVNKNPDQLTYNNGDNVVLTPTPDSGYEFTSWSGDAIGTNNPLTVLMDADKNITANFSLIGTTFTLNVTAVNGTVSKNPDQLTYNDGDNVVLTPAADAGYAFDSWSGDVTGIDNPLTVLMDANKNITANFILSGVAIGPGVIDLGTAGEFVILSKSGISNTGVTSITGNIGVSPIDQTALTGFSQTMDVSNEFSTSDYVIGNIYASDYSPPTPTYLTTAISDQETAFTTANGLTTNVIVDLGAGDISGMTLAPGLYKWGTGLLITNAGVTLSGGPDDTWVFQISDDFTIDNDAIITLTGGAQAKNIFWVTQTQALLGSNVQFKGNVLAKTLISVNTGTAVSGILLSQTAVTLNAATVVKP
jgi:uncharacterized repeat protein (TIGR02543 family)